MTNIAVSDSACADSLMSGHHLDKNYQLAGFGLMAVTGEDATTFLQGQLTNDVVSQDLTWARLNGYCSPKGRLLASFLCMRTADGFLFMISKDILSAIAKRLSMYVMRAKVRVADVSEQWRITGVLVSTRNPGTIHLDASPDARWKCVQTDDGFSVRSLPSLGLERELRFVRVRSDGPVDQIAAATDEPGDAVWDWLDIRAGLPWVRAAVQEKFVPQMINFEALGGVDFKKGCYPGQEIVARSQYLGKLKRRTALAHAATDRPAVDFAAGQSVSIHGSPEDVQGVVVAAQNSPLGGIDLLVEISISALEAGALTVGEPAVALDYLQLPSPLPDNDVFVRPKL